MPYASKEEQRAAARRFYAANKEKYVKWRRQQTKRHRVEVIAVVHAYKENHPCSDCQQSFPHYCMDFDHIEERGKKTQDISKMLSNCVSLPRVLKEIEKCDVVCSNCHRIRSHKRSMKRKTHRDKMTTGVEPAKPVKRSRTAKKG